MTIGAATIGLRFLAALAAGAAVFMAGAAGAMASAPKLLGTYQDWGAYTFGDGAEKICYAFSEPKTMAPANVNRGDTYVMVTHRPAKGVRNEVSLRNGYVFSEESRPFSEVGDRQFQMFTGVPQGGESAHWAWVIDTNDEKALVDAMRAGRSMTVKGTSSRGTLTTDSYSLSGISAALRKIDEACAG